MFFTGLTDDAIQIALERLEFWEYRLFLQVVADEICKYKNLHNVNFEGVTIGEHPFIDRSNISQWLEIHHKELNTIEDYVRDTFSYKLKYALGLPGHPGDVNALIATGIEVGLIYKRFDEWAMKPTYFNHDHALDYLFNLLSKQWDTVLTDMEAFGPASLAEIDKAQSLPFTGQVNNIKMTFSMEFSSDYWNDTLSELTKIFQNLN